MSIMKNMSENTPIIYVSILKNRTSNMEIKRVSWALRFFNSSGCFRSNKNNFYN